jgi:hypothetical protein
MKLNAVVGLLIGVTYVEAGTKGCTSNDGCKADGSGFMCVEGKKKGLTGVSTGTECMDGDKCNGNNGKKGTKVVYYICEFKDRNTATPCKNNNECGAWEKCCTITPVAAANVALAITTCEIA